MTHPKKMDNLVKGMQMQLHRYQGRHGNSYRNGEVVRRHGVKDKVLTRQLMGYMATC